MTIASLSLVPAPAQAFPALQAPFQVGVTWYVCQGYNGGITHGGDPSLDLTTDPGRGPNGCYGNANHATGKPIYAPAAGNLVNLNNGYGGICITFGDGSSMYLGHLTNRRGTGPVAQGEQIGTVAAANSENNGGYAHLHLSARSGAGCGGSHVPLSGSARMAGAPDMTYSGAVNQWAGTAITRTGAGQLRGSLDSATAPAPGQLRVGGWAFDEDARTTAIGVHVYVGGPAGSANAQGFDLGAANGSRPDVGNAYPGVGNNHGFDRTIDVAKFGSQPVYVYALNAAGTPGENVLIASRTVTIPQPNPFGSFDELSTPKPGYVRVRGWTADPSAPTTSAVVHVYAGSKFLGAIDANQSRPDVGTAFPGYGNTHGFDATIIAPAGVQRVCTYGINIGVGNNNTELGCRSVTVTADVTPPETTITSSPAPTGTQTNASIAFTASESATFACQWDGGAWSTCVSPAAKEVSIGSHTFSVRATDAFGNMDATPATTAFTVSSPAAAPTPTPSPSPSSEALPSATIDTGFIQLRIGAIRHKSRLRVNLGPDSAELSYRFKIQRRSAGKWRTVVKARTKGAKDVRVIDLKRGRYRVIVPDQEGLQGGTKSVRLRR